MRRCPRLSRCWTASRVPAMSSLATTSTLGRSMSRLAATTVGTVAAASSSAREGWTVPTITSPSTRNSRKPSVRLSPVAAGRS